MAERSAAPRRALCLCGRQEVALGCDLCSLCEYDDYERRERERDDERREELMRDA